MLAKVILFTSIIGFHSLINYHAKRTIDIPGMGYIRFSLSGHIYRIQVEPKFRRCGIGSHLVKLAEARMLSNSVTGLALPSSRSFWKANGYSLGSEYDDRILKKIKYQLSLRNILTLIIPFPFSLLIM